MKNQTMSKTAYKKIIIGLASVAGIFLITLAPVRAALLNSDKTQTINNNVNQIAAASQYDTGVSLEFMIASIIRLALSVLGIIFLILIFFAGNSWMQSAGNEEKVKKAKENIRSLIIGLCLVIVAYALSAGIGELLAKVLISTPKAAPTTPSGFDYTPPNNDLREDINPPSA